MRRVACLAAALAAACGDTIEPEPGPLDRLYFPTGLAVHRPAAGPPRLLVASSNADLLFDDVTGGSVLALDPATDPAGLDGGVNVHSLAGDLALARNEAQDPLAPAPDACGTALPTPLALVASRGTNTLEALRIGPAGELSCDRCGVSLAGPFTDPLPVAVACRAGSRPRAFVGYLRSPSMEAWLTEYDLLDGTLRSAVLGAGPVRGFAYDAAVDRLYVVGLATGTPTPLRWVDLGGPQGCTLGLPAAQGGCVAGSATFAALSSGIELRSMALSSAPGAPRRAYLVGRRYEPLSAAVNGGRTVDLGGVLLVVDLVDDAFGGIEVQVVNEVDFGRGAQDVRVLPSTPARAGMRDVVAALAIDAGELLIYDDETGAHRVVGRSAVTGAPELGHQPSGLAVDPDPLATVARLYVGSFSESFVTPVDVPLDDPSPPDAAFVVTTSDGIRRIRGGTP